MISEYRWVEDFWEGNELGNRYLDFDEPKIGEIIIENSVQSVRIPHLS